MHSVSRRPSRRLRLWRIPLLQAMVMVMTFSDRLEPGKMHISIASPPDREKVVAEIFFGHELWAEVNSEGDKVTLEIYPQRTGEPWTFSYDDAVAAIHEARRRLVDG